MCGVVNEDCVNRSSVSVGSPANTSLSTRYRNRLFSRLQHRKFDRYQAATVIDINDAKWLPRLGQVTVIRSIKNKVQTKLRSKF